MKRDPSAAVLHGPDSADSSRPGEVATDPALVVHVVGSASEEVVRLLRSSLQACAAYGLGCCVVLIDKDEH